MRRAAFAALLLPAAVWAQEPPPALVEATEEASALCRDLGGAPAILEDYATSRDLNGDGRADFVTDLARLECGGAWGAFCGSSGCPVIAWLSTEGGYERFDLGRLRGFAIRNGEGAQALPELVASYDATRCADDAAEGCTRTWTFAVNAPDEPPVDAPPAPAPAAASAPAAQPTPVLAPGWTLRRVPGASPVALGGGTGEIASLAAFCLAGQPFLSVTFRERPQADRVELGFTFSQGAVSASAGYEETAGGAYVAALAEGPLADRLGGRDRDVAVSVDDEPQGTLSLDGSTRAVRAALEACRGP